MSRIKYFMYFFLLLTHLLHAQFLDSIMIKYGEIKQNNNNYYLLIPKLNKENSINFF